MQRVMKSGVKSGPARSLVPAKPAVLVVLAALGLLGALAPACAPGSGADDGDDGSGPDVVDVGDKGDEPNFHPGGTVELTRDSFLIDGRPVLLRGGTIQWFKLAPETWDDRLRRFKAAGYNTVDVYVAWRNHEPREGQFDFTTFDLARFLRLCQVHGLYVVLRPGPYITNEMDGGGVPAWVFAKTSKRSRDPVVADGTLNLRTNDRDNLDAVGRYFAALNRVVEPYLYTRGGPIVLYAVENEYNWFLQFFDIDKLADLPQGGAERPADQVPDVAGYFTALRDLVRKGGIDVPITTCPGDGTASATGDVAGIVPMPNVYGPLDHAEYTGWALLGEMHDPGRHGGVYRDLPTGVTETDRPATTLRRLIMGGMDAVLQFNAVGSAAEGRMNAVVLNGGAISGVSQVLDLLRKIAAPTPGTGFVRLPVGYFHNVLDYGGPIGPSGLLRPSFWNLRRTNLFFAAFDALIASAGRPKRSTDAWITAGLGGLDQRVRLRVGTVGTADPDANYRKISYWLELAGGAALLSLYHDGAQARALGKDTIEAFGQRFPRFTSITVPVESGAASSGAGRATEYAQLVPIRFPLHGLTLTYSTSEILTYRRVGDEEWLFVYGPTGSDGELRLDAPGLTLLARESGITVHEQKADSLTISVRHGAPKSLVVRAGGVDTRIVVLDRDAAGRTWFVPGPGGAAVALVGPAYVGASEAGLELEVEPGRSTDVVVISPTPVAVRGLGQVSSWDVATRRAHFRVDPLPTPSFRIALAQGEAKEDTAEAAPGYTPSGWISLGDAPDELERHGIYAGHAWYRAQVDLTAAQAQKPGALWIDSVSDFAAIYVNGQYLLTVAPLGTEVNSQSGDADYHFDLPPNLVHAGRNDVAIRVEIWGHGSFMWPRGAVHSVPIRGLGPVRIPGLALRIPALGFDGVKGVIGHASLGGVPIRGWSVRAGLGGDLGGWAGAFAGAARGFAPRSLPLELERGGVTWFRTRFRDDALPDPRLVFAPAVLRLRGTRARAAIYLNGRLIGRWLSDDAWLRRGAWVRPTRSAWMNTPADDFPVARELVVDGENELVLVVEDTSDATRGEAPGRIDSVELVPASENLARAADGTIEAAAAPLVRRPVWLE
jgi:hypothetical protein